MPIDNNNNVSTWSTKSVIQIDTLKYLSHVLHILFLFIAYSITFAPAIRGESETSKLPAEKQQRIKFSSRRMFDCDELISKRFRFVNVNQFR